MVSMLALRRELIRLSGEYPECADILNVASLQVRWRASAHRAREAAILKCLRTTPMTVDELCEEIIFYPGRSTHRRMRVAITNELTRLNKLGVVEARDRDGELIMVRRDGKPTRTPYYTAVEPDPRLLGHRRRSRIDATRDNGGVGPFSTTPRRG
jgi:DNA-binding transcriptional ArsR family regulator